MARLDGVCRRLNIPYFSGLCVAETSIVVSQIRSETQDGDSYGRPTHRLTVRFRLFHQRAAITSPSPRGFNGKFENPTACRVDVDTTDQLVLRINCNEIHAFLKL